MSQSTSARNLGEPRLYSEVPTRPAHPATPNEIFFYNRGEPYFELTNFSPHPIALGGIVFKTAESLYQSQKFEEGALQQRFINLSGREAFELAQKLSKKVRKDWRQVNLSFMRSIVACKVAQVCLPSFWIQDSS